VEEHEIPTIANGNDESRAYKKRPSQQSEPLIQADHLIKDSNSEIQYAVNEDYKITSMYKKIMLC